MMEWINMKNISKLFLFFQHKNVVPTHNNNIFNINYYIGTSISNRNIYHMHVRVILSFVIE